MTVPGVVARTAPLTGPGGSAIDMFSEDNDIAKVNWRRGSRPVDRDYCKRSLTRSLSHSIRRGTVCTVEWSVTVSAMLPRSSRVKTTVSDVLFHEAPVEHDSPHMQPSVHKQQVVQH